MSCNPALPKCLVCGDKIHRGGATCTECPARYHRRCWEYNERKCARFGCRRAKGEAIEKPPPTPMPTRPPMKIVREGIRFPDWLGITLFFAVCLILYAGMIVAVAVNSEKNRKEERAQKIELIRDTMPPRVRVDTEHWMCDDLRKLGYELEMYDDGSHVWSKE